MGGTGGAESAAPRSPATGGRRSLARGTGEPGTLFEAPPGRRARVGGGRRARPLRRAALAAAVAALLAGPAPAAPDPSALCDAAAAEAAARHGVPAAVLRALTRTETGRAREGKLRPWPWTVNFEGEGRWFDGPAEALDWIEARRARGGTSFDVGCFQVNHRWHGEHFDGVEQMFDPRANADYAARFLSDLHAEAGDWTRAAGWYHSRTPEFYNRYRKRFLDILARDEGAGTQVAGLDRALDRAMAGAAPETAPRPGAPAGAAIAWRAVDPAAPPSAGAVAVRLNRGGASPLRAARGPLFLAAPRRDADLRVAAEAGGDRAFP